MPCQHKGMISRGGASALVVLSFVVSLFVLAQFPQVHGWMGMVLVAGVFVLVRLFINRKHYLAYVLSIQEDGSLLVSQLPLGILSEVYYKSDDVPVEEGDPTAALENLCIAREKVLVVESSQPSFFRSHMRKGMLNRTVPYAHLYRLTPLRR